MMTEVIAVTTTADIAARRLLPGHPTVHAATFRTPPDDTLDPNSPGTLR